ncbi:hypothetical protein L210DRAFT_365563 [Boletus edulis BED1]|uniref:Uncharacterized protein n=1 Tax=Boletus edulis BED1 TaxID=1328754 RepID=A0AAD4C8H9_BOLED|nr:hypothetical protein L210DRAFT_365563 [Boletus edulis BED1]
MKGAESKLRLRSLLLLRISARPRTDDGQRIDDTACLPVTVLQTPRSESSRPARRSMASTSRGRIRTAGWTLFTMAPDGSIALARTQSHPTLHEHAPSPLHPVDPVTVTLARPLPSPRERVVLKVFTSAPTIAERKWRGGGAVGTVAGLETPATRTVVFSDEFDLVTSFFSVRRVPPYSDCPYSDCQLGS